MIVWEREEDTEDTKEKKHNEEAENSDSCLFEEQILNVKEDLFFLSSLKDYSDDSKESKKMKNLYDRVNRDRTSVEQALLSINNAIIHQKRGVFCIGKKSINSLIEKDKNHTTPKKLNDGMYRRLLKTLDSLNICKKILDIPSFNGYTMVFQVTEKRLLDRINVDIESQLKEITNFFEKKEKKKKKRKFEKATDSFDSFTLFLESKPELKEEVMLFIDNNIKKLSGEIIKDFLTPGTNLFNTMLKSTNVEKHVLEKENEGDCNVSIE